MDFLTRLFAITQSTLRRRILQTIFIASLLFTSYNSVTAFDTYWHWSITEDAARTYGFSDDAIHTLQFGSFAMDYFGPFITEVISGVGKGISYLELRDLPTTGEAHAASNFMHFDNLASELDRNWKIDYLWVRLLKNTRKLLAQCYADTSIKPDHRKRMILLTLGASLHMAEDFYSHSDWTHFDFRKKGFAMRPKGEEFDRAPTWFEVRKKLGAPSPFDLRENWKFHVCTGVFPPVDSGPKSSFGVLLSHTTMNHDNSQLYYNGESQIKFHGFGACPATDSASAELHQLFAVHTTRAAVIEFIALIEKDPAAKKAIDFAKGWDIKKAPGEFEDDLKDGMYSALMISCIMKKWDGIFPRNNRDSVCSLFNLLPHIHIPLMSNIFWRSYPKDSILQKLTIGMGDTSGHYAFDSLWTGRLSTN